MKNYDQESNTTTEPLAEELLGGPDTWYYAAGDFVGDITDSEAAGTLTALTGWYTNPGGVVGAVLGSTASLVDPATGTVGGAAIGSTSYRIAQELSKGNLEYDDLVSPRGLAATAVATGNPTAAAAGVTYVGRNIEQGIEVAQEGADAASEGAEASMEVVDTLLSGAADAAVGATNEAGKALSQHGPELADQAPEVAAAVAGGLAATYAAVIAWDNYGDDDF